MILLIIDRKNNTHLVDYCHINGKKYTVCGKVYSKGDILNTLQLDGVIPDICRDCHDTYEEMYTDDLNDTVRVARGKLLAGRISYYLDIQMGHRSTKSKFWFLPERFSEKIQEYQKSLDNIRKKQRYGHASRRK